MAVSLYFGLPGSGKTTLLASHAIKAIKGKKYKHVYSNVRLNIPGITYIMRSDLGHFNISDGLVLIDEATLSFDSRNFKSFTGPLVEFFLLHRHYNVDIELFTQQWDGVDRKIRVITDRVYYIFKTPLTGFCVSKYYRIPYGIIIPEPNEAGDNLGEIIQGYCKPSLLERIFCHRVFRPAYYKYFDSWEAPQLPELPSDRLYIPGSVLDSAIEQK